MKRVSGAKAQLTPLQSKILCAVEELGVGEVVSFGDIASRAGRPDAARAAGAVLAGAADHPWWRVVYSDGHLPPCNPGLQAQRLIEEGVTLRGFRVLQSPRGRFASK